MGGEGARPEVAWYVFGVRPLVCALVLALLPRVAWGQVVCAESTPEFFPLDRSTSIPRNGIVRVLFRQLLSLPEHRAEDLIDVYDDGEMRLEGATVLQNDATDRGSEAIWRSARILPADTALRVVVEDPIGTPREFGFTTGTLVRDETPPVFEGADDVEIVDAAGDLDEPSYEVRVSFPSADDEAGSGNVEYVVYQTDGPDWVSPVERKRVRCIGGAGLVAFVVPKSEIGRWACFQIRAIDMFGNSEDNDHEACGIPEGPGMFRSICSMAGSRDAGLPTAAMVVLALAARGTGTSARRSRRRRGI